MTDTATAAPPVPPPPPHRRSRWSRATILLVSALIIAPLIICGSVLSAFGYAFFSVKGNVEPVLAEFFEAVASGDYAGANALRASSWTSRQSSGAFERAMEKTIGDLGAYEGMSFRTLNTQYDNGVSTAHAAYVVRFANGERLAQVKLVKEDDAWRLTDVSFQAPSGVEKDDEQPKGQLV